MTDGVYAGGDGFAIRYEGRLSLPRLPYRLATTRDGFMTADDMWPQARVMVDCELAPAHVGDGVFTADKQCGTVTSAGFGRRVGKSLVYA